ncbi:protein-(glutamine-N5) methyltransferase, release factor-specific [Candidatus Endolissoclinum faulkneri L2]|uniref:peptide chain release factor N(5)-glutamine methyltransferase n=1 Tax=Candidatus Endolissoclinum faulkneri L2 TaxID=1193729 RepID=K7Z4F1_9PROT|nr:peptide chain release factor N(5)-glutamine methyltransferase [Candidatus Endolissoclinum faulkneri]AFX98888.1 protein-(glutamine-N5) methyltransferase, release factor-specific [Candidatus Endolissoclinum faulkneri L2]
MNSIRNVIRFAAADFACAGINNARLNARLLLSHLLNRTVWPHEEEVLDSKNLEQFQALISRHIAGEPVNKITGQCSFWTLELMVTADTLDPRPDSETLIEATLEIFINRKPPSRVLDLGTGTGCLLLAALSEFPTATGLGIDSSLAASEVARHNAKMTGLSDRAEIRCQNWNSLQDNQFDLILSNPPYVAEDEILSLEDGVRNYDPLNALVGGVDGLDAYRVLAPLLRRVLSYNGVTILELGIGQANAVAAIMLQAGLREISRKADLSNIPRALVLK